MEKRRKKKAAIALSLTGALILALAVFLTVVCGSRFLHAGAVATDGAYSSVLSGIEGISEADPRVVDLSMLGAHDANTCNLERAKGFSCETGRGVRAAARLAPGLVYRYTKTQVSTVAEQLAEGVRYFHFKVSYFEGDWYGSHSLLDAPFSVCLRDILEFLGGSPGEIVILQIQMMYGGEKTFSEFVSYLFTFGYGGHTLGEFVPYESVPLGGLTYNAVTANGAKGGAVVAFAIDSKLPDQSYFYDPGQSDYREKIYVDRDMMTNVWFNRMKTSAVAAGLDEHCAAVREDFGRYKDLFRVMQIDTAPNARDFWETAGAWSLVNKAKKHNLQILENPHFDSWMEVLPIVLCDFSTSASGGFNQKVNEKIAAYNRRTVEELLRQP